MKDGFRRLWLYIGFQRLRTGTCAMPGRRDFAWSQNINIEPCSDTASPFLPSSLPQCLLRHCLYLPMYSIFDADCDDSGVTAITFPCHPIAYKPPTIRHPSHPQSRPRSPLRHLIIYWLHRRHVIPTRCSCSPSSIRQVCYSPYGIDILHKFIGLVSLLVMSLSLPSVSLLLAYNPSNTLWLEIVLLAYDSILTCQSEMEHVWKKKLKLGTALYVLPRYPALFVMVLIVLLNHSNDIIWI